MSALTVLCALACLALVAAEWRGAALARVAAKCTASAAFVAVGLVAAARAPSPYATGIAIGLGLGAVGDVFLLGRTDRAFLGGLVAFLGGHLTYVVALCAIEPIARWPADAGWLALVAVGLSAGVLAWLWPRLGKLRGAVIAYVAVITAMVIGAIAAARGGLVAEPRAQLIACAAVVFYASDLAVARERFVQKSLANRMWGLPCYYAAQLLFAWTIS